MPEYRTARRNLLKVMETVIFLNSWKSLPQDCEYKSCKSIDQSLITEKEVIMMSQL